jgi:hypothetical protein
VNTELPPREVSERLPTFRPGLADANLSGIGE